MINKIKQNVFQLYFKQFGSTTYVIKLRNKNIIIDTSAKENEEELISDLNELNIPPENVDTIILTHNHWDHVGNNDIFKSAKILNCKNKKEIESLSPNIKIIDAKGHTQTDICILYDDILFSGDVIFHDGFVGRTDFPESDPKEMEKSLKKLSKLKYDILCPGHL